MERYASRLLVHTEITAMKNRVYFNYTSVNVSECVWMSEDYKEL